MSLYHISNQVLLLVTWQWNYVILTVTIAMELVQLSSVCLIKVCITRIYHLCDT